MNKCKKFNILVILSTVIVGIIIFFIESPLSLKISFLLPLLVAIGNIVLSGKNTFNLYIVTDGLQSYKRAIKKEFTTNTHETEHLYNVGLRHHPNNNHVERLHGEIRSREKTMRGMKIDTTPIIEGHRLYHNFIKPHMALDGKTPSEEAGITIDGDNKWMSLMKTALWYKKAKAGVKQF